MDGKVTWGTLPASGQAKGRRPKQTQVTCGLEGHRKTMVKTDVSGQRWWLLLRPLWMAWSLVLLYLLFSSSSDSWSPSRPSLPSALFRGSHLWLFRWFAAVVPSWIPLKNTVIIKKGQGVTNSVWTREVDATREGFKEEVTSKRLFQEEQERKRRTSDSFCKLQTKVVKLRALALIAQKDRNPIVSVYCTLS